mmetsp:Transcript_27885/g.56916  ORF Transcript_27885/g.56916 Transcript_27885/m.56916 type:complete len:224 (-) Transcript_27885:206-877(-)
MKSSVGLFCASFLLLSIHIAAFCPTNFGTGIALDHGEKFDDIKSGRSNQRSHYFPSARIRPIKKSTTLGLTPEVDGLVRNSVSNTASVLLSSETESWRQYVPLVVSVGVIIDILLGSPLANIALGPMRRASEKGATGDSNRDCSAENGGGGSLFSGLGGTTGNSKIDIGKNKERVDSEAIAQAAIDKARNTLELKRFLEENKTNEQRYDEMRRKIDKQMNELD